MKKLTMACVAFTLLASPAWALKITNLDKVSHRVLFDSAGNKQIETIAPDETVIISGQPSGVLSLLSANPPKPSKGTLHADGLLSGIVGAVRSENIPADDGDEFVIWSNGQLLLQKHATNIGNGNIF